MGGKRKLLGGPRGSAPSPARSRAPPRATAHVECGLAHGAAVVAPPWRLRAWSPSTHEQKERRLFEPLSSPALARAQNQLQMFAGPVRVDGCRAALAVPAKKQPGAESKSVESSIKSTVTPIAAAAGKENKSPFSQGTGSANEEEPAESGSCNSASGYEGLALMSVLLIPGVLKYRRRKE